MFDKSEVETRRQASPPETEDKLNKRDNKRKNKDRNKEDIIKKNKPNRIESTKSSELVAITAPNINITGDIASIKRHSYVDIRKDLIGPSIKEIIKFEKKLTTKVGTIRRINVTIKRAKYIMTIDTKIEVTMLEKKEKKVIEDFDVTVSVAVLFSQSI